MVSGLIYGAKEWKVSNSQKAILEMKQEVNETETYIYAKYRNVIFSNHLENSQYILKKH